MNKKEGKRRKGYPQKTNCQTVRHQSDNSPKRQINNMLQNRITQLVSFVNPHSRTVCIKIRLFQAPKMARNTLFRTLPTYLAHIPTVRGIAPYYPPLSSEPHEKWSYFCIGIPKRELFDMLKTNQIRANAITKPLIPSNQHPLTAPRQVVDGQQTYSNPTPKQPQQMHLSSIFLYLPLSPSIPFIFFYLPFKKE